MPVYLKDIAEVNDSTEDIRSVLRINGRPASACRSPSSRAPTRCRLPQGVRAEIERINREVPGVQLTLLDDSAKFIERVDRRRAGARDDRLRAWSSSIIFLFLRNFRSTLIVCTSIPISVVGTFALLYFAG